MMIRSAYLVRAAVLTGAVIALGGCESLREAAGVNKSAPDEFAVLTKAPLVVPPDYNLRPPRPGAPPTNQTDPGQAAQSALFGSTDPTVVAANMTGSFSEGEKLLMAQAGVSNADPAIREHLAADRKGMIAANKDFTDEVLFWKGPKKDTGTAVNADSEAKRMDAQKAGNAAQKPAEPPKPEDKGWFDGWFDWL